MDKLDGLTENQKIVILDKVTNERYIQLMFYAGTERFVSLRDIATQSYRFFHPNVINEERNSLLEFSKEVDIPTWLLILEGYDVETLRERIKNVEATAKVMVEDGTKPKNPFVYNIRSTESRLFTLPEGYIIEYLT